MRIPVQIEVEIRPDIRTESHKDRFVDPWRGEVLIGGQRTGAYAMMEVSKNDFIPPEEIAEHLTSAAIGSWVSRMRAALG